MREAAPLDGPTTHRAYFAPTNAAFVSGHIEDFATTGSGERLARQRATCVQGDDDVVTTIQFGQLNTHSLAEGKFDKAIVPLGSCESHGKRMDEQNWNIRTREG